MIKNTHFTTSDIQFIKDNLHLPRKEIARRLDRTEQSVHHKCRRLELKKSIKGSSNANWKGGISYLKSGYVKDNVKDRLQHSLIMENYLDRKLESTEMIHHVNGEKANNELDNLFLCKNAAHHRQLHASLERVSYKLVQSGVIKFNRENECYELGGIE